MTQTVIIRRSTGERVEFDLWNAAEIDGAAQITEHPIEDGAKASDHAQADPRRYTLSVSVSETPLGDVPGARGEERVTEAIRFLDEIGRSGEGVQVEIPRVAVLEDLRLARWPGTMGVARSIAFELVVQEIEIAEVSFVAVPIEAIAPRARAGNQPEEDLGTQTTDEITPEEVNERSTPPSVLTQLFDRFGG